MIKGDGLYAAIFILVVVFMVLSGCSGRFTPNTNSGE